MGIVSFEAYMVNRREPSPIVFEGTFSNEYVKAELAESLAEGFEPEFFGPNSDVRMTYIRHEDGRPWVYREFYAVDAA